MFQSPSRGGHLRGAKLGMGSVAGGSAFQSPSRGGHLRGSRRQADFTFCHSSFSPLHEGDTSVAIALSAPQGANLQFQSPSRGGHLRGHQGQQSKTPLLRLVSVPFTRGTPPWRLRRWWRTRRRPVSVPFTRGTPPWRRFDPSPRVIIRFQSPSRGGHLRGTGTVAASWSGTSVSVPFTRGTPPWHWYLTAAGGTMFQSPSRGGHLRGGSAGVARDKAHLSFSPLHEGDTSVARPADFNTGTLSRFSPLHEGDTSVARKGRYYVEHESQVSVPFTRGTPPWRRTCVGTDRYFNQFQSPSRGGHLRG